MFFLVILLMLGGTDGCLDTFEERQQLVDTLENNKAVFFESLKGSTLEQSGIDMYMNNGELDLIHAKKCSSESDIIHEPNPKKDNTEQYNENSFTLKTEIKTTNSEKIQCETNKDEHEISVEINCLDTFEIKYSNPDDINLNTIVNIIGIASIAIAAVGGIWGTEKRREDNLRNKARDTIKEGINQLGKEFEQLKIDKPGKEGEYLTQYLSTHHFDGVISSGAFVLLNELPASHEIDPEDKAINPQFINLQTDLENIYFQIKQHNFQIQNGERLHTRIELMAAPTENQITLAKGNKRLKEDMESQIKIQMRILRDARMLIKDTDKKIKTQMKYLKRNYSFFNR